MKRYNQELIDFIQVLLDNDNPRIIGLTCYAI